MAEMEVKAPKTMKIVKDPIHGFIELNPLVVKIIDTPQFQRLRHLKQLGAAYYVYPGASHNRFEHCLGTYHLASTLLQELKKRLEKVKNSYPKDDICKIEITERDILRVEVAALCHDLGHGPFSHMFESLFLKEVRKDEKAEINHEVASIKMLEYLVEKNNLKREESQDLYEGLTESDMAFIGRCINPKSDDVQEKGKEFLYEIVSNSRTGIDVDKWDYFARDCHHLGLQSTFDHERFLKTARVVKHPENDTWTIAYRQKDVEAVHEMFQARKSFHRRAYQHQAAKGIELMIAEAFKKADPHITFKGIDGEERSLSTAIDDPSAYTKLNDDVANRIAWSEDDRLSEARELIQRIMKRDLYRYLGEYVFDREELPASEQNLKKKFKMIKGINDALMDKYVKFYIFPLEAGKKDEDPIKNLIVYTTEDLTKGTRNHKTSSLYPKVFTEWHAHVYFNLNPSNKEEEEKDYEAYKKVKKAFKEIEADGETDPKKRKL